MKYQPIEIGSAYGKLTVISRGPDWISPSSGYGKKQFYCRCECGKEKLIAGPSLQRSLTLSCGCIQKEKAAYNCRKRIKHGHASGTGRLESPEYNTWHAMIARCENPKSSSYGDYGARGISVCARWHDFKNFLDDMGLKPSTKFSIDRIDVNGNYEPGNCQWATPKQQKANQRPHIRPRDDQGRFTSEVIYPDEHS